MRLLVNSFLSLLLLAPGVVCAAPDVRTIIQRSVEANQRDWDAAPGYAYVEEDRDGQNEKTYQVTMIEGSPYRRLIKINNEPLSGQAEKTEQKKLNEAIKSRRAESHSARARRVAQYEKSRRRDHLLMGELTRAFQFTLAGEQAIDGHQVYQLRATPLPGYAPPNTETRVLTGMDGELWIDKQSFQWVKVFAHVIRPVSIAGFLAQVDPGTSFELEKVPVGNGIWLPKHFVMHAHARILALIGHNSEDDETYSDYRKIGGDKTNSVVTDNSRAGHAKGSAEMANRAK